MMGTETDNLKLIRQWIEDQKHGASTDERREPDADDDVDAVAITGLSGYFPGCSDVASFFKHIDRDESLLTPFQEDRLKLIARGDDDVSALLRNQMGGYLPDIASFDAGLFGILPLEAEEMDPRQRLLLMSVWRTLEDAGLDPASLRKSATGVFIGCESNEYAQLMARAGFTPAAGLSQSDSMMANRISYHFDFAGPSEMVNATCAGFAVALHRAFTALSAGQIERAIVGAANVILLPDAFRVLREAGQLTPGGTVQSFGKHADGFLRSEGVGTVLIERRRDAESGRRPVYAVIRNVAVNFNGQGGVSMASPNIEAHARLIQTCYREAGIDPRRIGYLEAQGMGLPVADIAEWSAINRGLQGLCDEMGLPFEAGFCRVSTLKPLVGHMHSAASLGALLRVIRSFQTDKIHRIDGFKEANEFCETEGMPCRFAVATESWPQAKEPRLAALHSFGSGGNNAHVLLEEYRGELKAVADRQEKVSGREFDLKPFWFRPERVQVDQTADDIEEKIQSAILEAMGQPNRPAILDSSFTALGLDSLALGALVSRLELDFGVAIRKSAPFSHATPGRFAKHVASLVRDTKRSSARENRRLAMPSRKHDTSDDNEDIAIVGMSLRVAGAEDHEAFWQLLREGKCGVSTLPRDRVGCQLDENPEIWGGFLPSIDAFDPLFFGIAPRECETMDPRHRLLLEGAWAAIEDAGYNPQTWRGAEHGIFLGIEESDYPVSRESPITSVHGGTAPARIGYFLDTKGPLLAISTACSSSLVAVHYACKSILSGESDCALAGGCNILCQPGRAWTALSQMGNMLSRDGVCYAFDGRANGMVLGEGVGLVVLKRLSHARRDNDSIYAVIRGSGVNYDGRTNGLTAPSGERQRELYERVQRQSGVRPEQISYIVAHGTGTALGDPIECHALMDAFGDNAGREPYCALTSPKTNIGHTQAASGIVNLITAALALHHREIPPSLHYENANPEIHLEGSPFYVNTSLKAWDAPARFAAASSFGHSGTNAHVLLSDSGEQERVAETHDGDEPVMIVLSAKTEERLRGSARGLLRHPVAGLRETAYTLQTGRAPMDVRLGFTARSVAEMRLKLNAFLDGETAEGQIFWGEVSSETGSHRALTAGGDSNETAREWVKQGQHAKLLKLWVEGMDFDWDSLYDGPRPARVHLPTYPFEKERFWLNSPNAGLEEDRPPIAEDEPDASRDDGLAVDEVLTFEEEWTPAPLVRTSAAGRGTGVCVVRGAAEPQRVADLLASLSPATRWEFVQDGDAEGLERTFREIRDKTGDPEVVFDLRAVGNAAVLRQPFTLVPLLQGLASSGIRPDRVLIACPFTSRLDRCYADGWVGCEKSLRRILPGTSVVVVGIRVAGAPEVSTKRIAEKLHDEWHAVESESVLYDGEQRLAARIREAAPERLDSPLKQGGTYLITGGGGELGLLLAEHFVNRYEANVVLIGRSELSLEKRSRLLSLIKQGSGAMYLQADACDADGMKRAVETAKERFGTLHGAIHAAGVESTQTILEKEAVVFQRVTDPKMQGTLVLDEVLKDEPLSFLACFSSSAASLGDFGGCDYAIGNRFQVAFSRYRNELTEQGDRCGKCITISWPVWKQGGMARDKSGQTDFYLKTSGQRALETREGLALFEQLVADRRTQPLILAGNCERIMKLVHGKTASLAGEPEKIRKTDSQEAAMGQGRGPEHKGFSVEECLRWDVSGIAGGILKIRRERFRANANFGDLGFDSMSLTELAQELTRHFAIEISPALFFRYSSASELCRYLLAEYQAELEAFYGSDVPPEKTMPSDPPAATVLPRETDAGRKHARPEGEPIAIIGMSGRFPQARDVEAMWRTLADGRDAVEEVPADRFDWREFYGDPASSPRKTNGRWGGFVPGVAEFDPLFFEISPREAEVMDPRQRLLLQEAWNALEDAGCGPRYLSHHKVGMFVGAEEGDYVFLGGDQAISSNHNGILASRLPYFLNLRGPVLAINTACSSGLVAAHQACQSLRAGECDAALVAGVNLILTPAGMVAMGQSRMLSPDGKCFAFDKRANGMAPGEAVIAMVLKPLSRAEADGDPIHAVIRGSAVNYDGRTNGITAPNGEAQREVLQEAYARAGVRPSEVEYIVTHGTGTKLGDPVESQALWEAFRDGSERRGYCALTSTKSNFGHTFAASGLLSAASLVKAFQNELIPASLHCVNENEYVRWEESPFFINKSPRPWPSNAERKRVGGVSAFGMSGTNVHMVMEEYCESRSSNSSDRPCHLLVVSAKTQRALRERAAGLVEALQSSPDTAHGMRTIESISYTLLEGRHPFRCRLAMVVQDCEDAVRVLAAWLGGDPSPHVFEGEAPLEFQGQKAIRRHVEEMLRQCAGHTLNAEDYREALLGLANYYCQGYDVDWGSLFGSHPPRRLHLPTYPFERESYWVGGSANADLMSLPGRNPKDDEPSVAGRQFSPDRDVSNSSSVRFTSRYTGQEPFLADHVVHGEKILPAAGFLGMVCAAVEQALETHGPIVGLQLRNIVWMRPLSVPADGAGVMVDLEPKDRGFRFECRSESGVSDSATVTHTTGTASVGEATPVHALDIAALQQRMQSQRVSAEECYEAFRSGGVSYGPFYRLMRELWIGGEESLAQIELPDGGEGWTGFTLHPAVMDAAFQATLGIQIHSSAPRVPFALERLTVYRAIPARVWAWARRSEGRTAGGQAEKFDIDLCDEDGNVAVRLSGFSTRAMADPGAAEKSMTHVLTGEEFYLKDHGGLLPGVVSLEWAQATGFLAGQEPVAGLRQIVWKNPIQVNGKPREVRTSVQQQGKAWVFRVSSGEVVHAEGKVIPGGRQPGRSREPREAESAAPSIALKEIEARCNVTISPEDCAALLHTELGPTFRSLLRFQHNGREALASLEIPASARSASETYRLHPSVMNGAVQAANLLAMVRHPGSQPPIPFSIDALWIHRELPERVFAYVSRQGGESEDSANSGPEGYEILIADSQGRVSVSIRGYYAVFGSDAGSEGVMYAATGWRPHALAATGSSLAGSETTASPVFLLGRDQAAWEEALQRNWPEAKLIFLPARGEISTDMAQASFVEAFRSIQDCIVQESGKVPPMVLLVPDGSATPIQAAVAGLFRTVRLEQAGVDARVIHLALPAESALDARWVRILTAEIGRQPVEAEVRYDEHGDRFVAAVDEVRPASLDKPAIAQGDVVWITGGFGGVGLEFARYLAKQRKARVVLSGRSPWDEEKGRVLDELFQEGAYARYLPCDIADSQQVEQALKSILDVEGKLNGVVHCAGVTADKYLTKKTAEEAAMVLAPKVTGTLVLDEATRGVPLNFMVYCSSLTGSYGNPGQADYAGANAFMDAFARERNLLAEKGQRSGRTVSIAWPLWRDGGMRLDEGHAELLKRNSGMTPMPTGQAMEAFERCLQSGLDHVLVLHGERAAMRSKLMTVESEATLPVADTDAVSGDISYDTILEALTAMVAEQQKIPLEKIEADARLPQYGFDSLALTEFANRLNRRFDLELMPTLFFEKSSLRSLAKHLQEHYLEKLSQGLSAAQAASQPVREVLSAPQPLKVVHSAPQAVPVSAAPPEQLIAIVGMSGRFPGADDVDAFWRVLEANRDMISEVPAERWNWRECYGDPLEEQGKTKVNCAGFINGVEWFDPAFFGISPREAISMDPQLRLLLETVWSAIEDAGYRASELAGRRIGVFMGVSTSDYKEAWLRYAASGKGASGPALVSHFGIANRISYALDLHGPSQPIDTACSSSLIAIHRAAEAIRMGHCESALVGGVNAILTPDITIEASRAGILSEDGRCKTFDKRANGYGRGEGVAALYLKPVAQALKDGDHIYGVLRGSAENHGGRAASPTAPNSDAQRALLVEAYTRSEIDPRSVSYIEAHGTGTELGDAVEIDGLRMAFSELYQRLDLSVAEQHCALGSVKTNIGHLEAAAGMAGVIKVLQMFRHRRIPGNPHLKEPNPYLRLEETPFYLAAETREWNGLPDGRGGAFPRRAGISSFGIGGSNAHLILEAFEEPSRGAVGAPRQDGHGEAIVLSARNADRLRAYIAKLLVFLRNPPEGALPSLSDFAWTLQVGRESMKERMGFIAREMDEVIEKLTSFMAGDSAFAQKTTAEGITNNEAPFEQNSAVEKMLRAWLSGAEVEWSSLQRAVKPHRVPLPTYAFERKRYWFGEEPKTARGLIVDVVEEEPEPLQKGSESLPQPLQNRFAVSEELRNGSSVGNGSPKPKIELPEPVVSAREVTSISSSRAEAIESYVEILAGLLAKSLYMDISDISYQEPFIDLGLDSVIGVEWIQAVNRHFGIRIPATTIYDHPNLLAFAEFLASQQVRPSKPERAEEGKTATALLDELLQGVQSGDLDIENAQHLIEALGPAEQKGGRP